MMIPSPWPLDQSPRLTISWMIALRSGVRWPSVSSPTTVQSGGDQVCELPVMGRDETSPEAPVKLSASPVCPRIVRSMVPDVVSSTLNCTQAALIVAPRGMVTFSKRIPTTWAPRLPSSVSSRSLLDRLTLPVGRSSASSSLRATRRSSVVGVEPWGRTSMVSESLPASSPSLTSNRKTYVPSRGKLTSVSIRFALPNVGSSGPLDRVHVGNNVGVG